MKEGKLCPNRRRTVLECLKTGEKNTDELLTASQFKGGKEYVRKLMRGLQKLGFVKRTAVKNVVYYSITKKGENFLSKESLEDV
jgi:predicted transcriptional regulator